MPALRKNLLASLAAGVLVSGSPQGHTQTLYADPAMQDMAADIEYGTMRYVSSPRTDAVAQIEIKNLEFHPQRGYLDALLQKLDISPASQLMVFSRTSLNIEHIKPQTPRAIYFNDNTYVAWIPGSATIEIASMDPHLGQVFYTLEQNRNTGPVMEKQTAQCLRCHDSYSLTGGGVPRFLLGSGYTGINGSLVSHEGWILTSTATPFESRWGGWYVTGRHGKLVHLGNIAVTDPSELYQLDTLRKGNIDSLDSMMDPSPYLAKTSDIVALLVIEHQVEVQNLITRVNYDVRTALQNNPELLSGSQLNVKHLDTPVRQLLQNQTEPLVRAMLMLDEEPLTDAVTGSPAYSNWFQSSGPRDRNNRSLRDLDLHKRVFRYPLSYLVYSNAFQGLPELARQQIYLRLNELLTTAQLPEGYERLAESDRTAVVAILNDTLPDFVRVINLK